MPTTMDVMQGGYEYVLALTRAIEAWSAAVTRDDPTAFIHRGADLRYAAERSLFFERVHDAGLRNKFAASGGGEFEVAVPLLPMVKRLRYEMGNLSRLARTSLVTARLKKKPDFLFLAIHPKFVTFMKPIADALGDRAAFLTVLDPVTDAHLEKLGFPTVSVRLAFTASLAPRGVLGNFTPLCRDFDLVSAMIAKLQPRAIAVPEGNAPVYEIANRAGRPHRVATVCIQHGAPAYTNPGFRNWTFENVLVWGSQFIEPFAKYNPQQRFTAVGTPATFTAPPPREDRAPIRHVGFFLQKAAENIPLREWRAMLAFIAWCARTFPAITFLVREHPTQPRLDAAELALLAGLSNLRFMSPPEFGLDEVLSLCDVVVAGASTTLVEAVAVGAIPFIFGTAFSPDFPKIDSEGAAVMAKTLDAAKPAMMKLVEDGDFRASLRVEGLRMRPELFACYGQEAAVRIAGALCQAADFQER